jgi:hypothetical protein
MALLRHCQTRFSTGEKHVLPPDPISTPTASCSTQSSLPHIYDNLPVPSPSSSLRPGLTGQDAEPEPLRVPSVSRKLGSRYSPLNLFGKAGESVGNAKHRTQYPRITTNASPSRSWHYPLSTPQSGLLHLSPSSPAENCRSYSVPLPWLITWNILQRKLLRRGGSWGCVRS